jgi:hypothetical protein
MRIYEILHNPSEGDRPGPISISFRSTDKSGQRIHEKLRLKRLWSLNGLEKNLMNSRSDQDVALGWAIIIFGPLLLSTYFLWPFLKDQFQPTTSKLISRCEEKVAFAAGTTRASTVNNTGYANTFLVRIDVESGQRKGVLLCTLTVNGGGWISTVDFRLTPDTPLWIVK